MENYIRDKVTTDYLDSLKTALNSSDNNNKLAVYENFRFSFYYYLNDAITKNIVKSSRNIREW